MQRALTWELWEAANIIHRAPCSQDPFLYFRLWLIAQGRETFEAAVADPDTLAGHPQIRRLSEQAYGQWQDSDYPHMEDLLQAGEMAFDGVLAKLGPDLAANVGYPEEFEETPAEISDAPPPSGFDGEHEIRSRYPNLIRLFSWPLRNKLNLRA